MEARDAGMRVRFGGGGDGELAAGAASHDAEMGALSSRRYTVR